MYETLMEAVVADENCKLALQAVKRNQGAAGIDRMTTEQLEPHLQAHWWTLQDKLLKGSYVPSPVRRVAIPKPNGGTRMLGIPTVQDRFIQQLLLQVLTPIFDPHFSEHSYGFRPGRSAQDAVRAAQQYAQGGKDWVVDIDITKFFDAVNHDILMGRMARVIRDKRVLHLIGKYLRRGAMVDGLVEASEVGTPPVYERRGPLSPLLANIYLDALDQELDRQSGGGGTHAGLGTGLDREASATAGECRQKRNGEGLGTQVPGLSTGSREADRDSTGEPGEIQGEGS